MGINFLNGLIQLDPQLFSTVSGDNDNLVLDSSKLFVTTTNDLDALTGLKVAYNETGYSVWVNNVHATNVLLLKNDDAGTDAGFRFMFGKDIHVPPGAAMQIEFVAGTGWLPVYTIPRKRRETFSGTTAGSGTVSFTFQNTYLVAPNAQANIIGGAVTNSCRITSLTTTGITVTANNMVSIIGLAPSFPALNGANIDIQIEEK